MIDQIAATEEISRGEVAKRLCSLALRGLTIDFYGLVRELAVYHRGGLQFDGAAELLAMMLDQGDKFRDECSLAEQLKLADTLVASFREVYERTGKAAVSRITLSIAVEPTSGE